MGLHDLYLRCRALLSRTRSESELDDELRFHLEMEAHKHRLAGLDERAARDRARAGFGGVEQIREACRDIRGITLLENAARDVRHAFHVLKKTPLFSAVAILSLAIAIGANTAVFSLVDTILLRTLPVKKPEQLVVLRWGATKDLDLNFSYSNGGGDGSGWHRNVVSWPVFTALRDRSQTINSVIGFSPLAEINVASEGQSFSTGGLLVSGNYFTALGVGTLAGRPITSDNETADGAPAAVISYRLWERVFGLDPAAIGKTLYVNGRPCTIVGVTPSSFFGLSAGGYIRTPRVDVMLPIRSKAQMEGTGERPRDRFADDYFWIQVVARRDPQLSASAAEPEIGAIIAANLPEAARRALGSEVPRVFVESASRGLNELRNRYQKPLLALTGIVAVSLLMACANLAGLLLARATTRQKEIMVRLAMGAGRWRLVRQLMVEGALLSGAGAILGTALAWAGVRGLLALVASGPSPILLDVPLDARVLAFTAAVSIVTTFLFALLPALRATRIDIAQGLKEDSLTASPARRLRSVRVLVTVQVAVALILVTGAALFSRTLANLRSQPLGFNASKLIVFDIAPGRNGYDEIRGNQLYERLRNRMQNIPGVAGVSLVSQRLITGWISNGAIRVEGSPSQARSTFNFVGPDFFPVMQIPVVLGRGIEEPDMGATPRVAVINETLARRAFDGQPLGKRFRWSDADEEVDVQVIGVVKDARYDRLRGTPPATVYAPYTQRPFGWPQQMSFAVRTSASPGDIIAGVRRAVGEVDYRLPLIDVTTMEGQIDEAVAQERLFAWAVSLFSSITLVLACVGLYGLVSYSLASRTREIGVRVALGADRPAVIGIIARQVAATALAGAGLGVPAAVALARIIESRLFGVKPYDPASVAISAITIAAVGVIAAFLPARRALRIDPVSALRCE